ncbi:MAG: ABC transporter permease [Actinomycetota bacterium]
MRQFLGMVSASLKRTYREKVALFWMFLFPVLLMLLLGAIFGGTGNTTINLGVVDLDQSVVTKGIVSGVKEIDGFSVREGTRKQQIDRLEDGRNNAVLILEEGFFDSLKQGKAGKVTVVTDKSSPTVGEVANSAVQQVIAEVSRGIQQKMGMATPPEVISVTTESITSSELGYIDYMVPGILALTIMQAGVFGLGLDFVANREKGIFRRIKVSPLPLSRFLGSEILSALVMALIQAALLLGVGWAVFRVHVKGNPLYIVFLVILGSLTFLAMGFLVSSLSRTLKTATMAANVVVFPQMFLAGVFFPLFLLPSFLVVVAKCLPLYYLGDALRQVMVRGKGITSVWLDILVLVGVGLVCFALSLKYFRWE